MSEQYIAQLEAQLDQAKSDSQNLQQNYATTMFNEQDNENLVKWQLDIREELIRIEHLLRKHIPRADDKGNEYYEAPPEGTELLNERGVNEILHLLNWYLNKNIILSNFSEEQIDLRMMQLADSLTDFIFINYEDFGLDDKDKIKHYPMIVMNVVNTIEAAYNRALNGGERESLRTARTVTQTEPIGMNKQFGLSYGQQMVQPKRFSVLRPSTWGR